MKTQKDKEADSQDKAQWQMDLQHRFSRKTIRADREENMDLQVCEDCKTIFAKTQNKRAKNGLHSSHV